MSKHKCKYLNLLRNIIMSLTVSLHRARNSTFTKSLRTLSSVLSLITLSVVCCPLGHLVVCYHLAVCCHLYTLSVVRCQFFFWQPGIVLIDDFLIFDFCSLISVQCECNRPTCWLHNTRIVIYGFIITYGWQRGFNGPVLYEKKLLTLKIFTMF